LIVYIDDIDITSQTLRNIIVVNTPAVLTDTTEDFAFNLLIATA
jgi:lactate dehydrogenase-like 2-hydroxyacid dehydrogenase